MMADLHVTGQNMRSEASSLCALFNFDFHANQVTERPFLVFRALGTLRGCTKDNVVDFYIYLKTCLLASPWVQYRHGLARVWN